MLIRSVPYPISGIQAEMTQLIQQALAPSRSSHERGDFSEHRGYWDLWTDDDYVYVVAELPGVSSEDIDLTIQGKTLSIIAERVNTLGDIATWHRRERRFGSIECQVALPTLVEAASVEAVLEDGLLRVTLPKKEDEKPRKVAVRTLA